MHDLILHPLIKVWYLLLLLIFHQKTFLKCFPKFHSWLIYHLWYFSQAKDHMLLLSSLQFSHLYHLLIQFLLYLNQMVQRKYIRVLNKQLWTLYALRGLDQLQLKQYPISFLLQHHKVCLDVKKEQALEVHLVFLRFQPPCQKQHLLDPQ